MGGDLAALMAPLPITTPWSIRPPVMLGATSPDRAACIELRKAQMRRAMIKMISRFHRRATRRRGR